MGHTIAIGVVRLLDFSAFSKKTKMFVSRFYRLYFTKRKLSHNFRVLFCNTIGCNSKRISWSKPVTSKLILEEQYFHSTETKSPNIINLKDTNQSTPFTINRRQTVQEENNLLALMEQFRTSPKSMVTQNINSANDEFMLAKP